MKFELSKFPSLIFSRKLEAADKKKRRKVRYLKFFFNLSPQIKQNEILGKLSANGCQSLWKLWLRLPTGQLSVWQINFIGSDRCSFIIIRGANTRLAGGEAGPRHSWTWIGPNGPVQGPHIRVHGAPIWSLACSPETHSPRSTFCTADGPKCRYP